MYRKPNNGNPIYWKPYIVETRYIGNPMHAYIYISFNVPPARSIGKYWKPNILETQYTGHPLSWKPNILETQYTYAYVYIYIYII